MTSKPASLADRLFSQLLLPALLCLLLAMISLQPAHAARQALVIGNDNYTSVAKLQKAGNDAAAMARELKAAGFAVQLHRDLNYRAMVRAVENFAGGIKGGDEVVVFFAGHGVQIKNGGYLLPTDIEATSESEVEKTAYELNALTDKLSEAKAAFSLVMVDACRDNPLKTRGRSVGNTRGLSAIEPPKGQMVVYSASKGQQALDRLNDKDANPNSVFTREFIARMKRPGVKIEELVREVQDAVEVLAGTIQHEQRPAIYNEARGNFYFFGPTTVQVAAPVALKPAPLVASPRPGQVVGLSLADLEREESTRKEWAAWQAKMKADFDKTVQFSGGADLQVKAWERFLAAWAQDNPQSQEDEGLRLQAQSRLAGARQAATGKIDSTPPATPLHSVLGKLPKDCPGCPVPKPLKIALAYVGPIGDGGWTFAHDKARKAIEKEFGAKVSVSYVEKVPEGNDAERVFRDLVTQGNKLIFGTTFGYMEPMLAVARQAKDVKFEHATGYKQADNMRSYDSRTYEGAYLAGMIAGKMTKSNVLGFIGSVPIPEVIRNINSFTLGAQSGNPVVRVKVAWVNDWFNPPRETEAAQSLINGGADVLMQNTDSSAVLQTAEKNGKYAFGWDSDMIAYGPKAHLGSAVTNWAPYYLSAVREALDGKWAAGSSKHSWWGVKEGAIDIVSVADAVPADVKAQVATVKAGLKDGSFTIWKGPLIGQDGKLILKKDEMASDKFLSSVMSYVKGVEGKVPGLK